MSDPYSGNHGNGQPSGPHYQQDPPTQSVPTPGASEQYGREGYGNNRGYGSFQNQQGAQAYGGQSIAQNNDAAGFFRALFDFSFDHFITPKVVKFVYILSVFGIGLMWLIFLLGAFNQSASMGAVVLLFGPIGAILYLVFIRMTLEFYLATVRMSEDIHQRLR